MPRQWDLSLPLGTRGHGSPSVWRAVFTVSSKPYILELPLGTGQGVLRVSSELCRTTHSEWTEGFGG